MDKNKEDEQSQTTAETKASGTIYLPHHQIKIKVKELDGYHYLSVYKPCKIKYNETANA